MPERYDTAFGCVLYARRVVLDGWGRTSMTRQRLTSTNFKTRMILKLNHVLFSKTINDNGATVSNVYNNPLPYYYYYCYYHTMSFCTGFIRLPLMILYIDTRRGVKWRRPVFFNDFDSYNIIMPSMERAQRRAITVATKFDRKKKFKEPITFKTENRIIE